MTSESTSIETAAKYSILFAAYGGNRKALLCSMKVKRRISFIGKSIAMPIDTSPSTEIIFSGAKNWVRTQR
jgi:hypothetical protein